jgi:hypothetical protein
MKKNTVTALVLCAVGGLYAQETASSSGGEAIGKEGSASFTLGQVVYITPSSQSNSETQGIQQPYEVYDVLEKDAIRNSNILISSSPNPTTDVVNLEINQYADENLSYQLLSLSGQLIDSKKIKEKITSISMKELAQGTYILKVTNNSVAIQTFKIIKN